MDLFSSAVWAIIKTVYYFDKFGHITLFRAMVEVDFAAVMDYW
jgi:hypothetical protein